MSEPHPQPRPPAYGQFPAQPGPPPGSADSMATWALVLSLIPCGPVYLVGGGLGVAVLVRSSRDRIDYGRRKAKIAIGCAIGWFVLAAVVVGLVIAFGGKPEPTSQGAGVPDGDVMVTDLRTGDCLRDAVAVGDVRTVKVVPCTKPHRAQVFTSFGLDDLQFPGADEASRIGRRGCTDRIPTALRRKNGPEATLVFVYPTTSAQFETNRRVTCLAQFSTKQTISLTP